MHHILFPKLKKLHWYIVDIACELKTCTGFLYKTSKFKNVTFSKLQKILNSQFDISQNQ